MVAQKRGHYVWWRQLAKVNLAPLGVTSLEYQQSVCYEKTRVLGLLCGVVRVI